MVVCNCLLKFAVFANLDAEWFACPQCSVELLVVLRMVHVSAGACAITAATFPCWIACVQYVLQLGCVRLMWLCGDVSFRLIMLKCRSL